MIPAEGCAFCAIAVGQAPAEIVARWHDAVAFTPLNPVTPGHTLVVPNEHVKSAVDDPVVTAQTMYRAADLAARFMPCNLITSVGAAATQTVFHLHIHVVPRRVGDGLALPWSGGGAA